MERVSDNMVECLVCHEVFDLNREGRWCEDGDLCDSCAEYDLEYASTLTRFCQEGKEVIIFGDYMAESCEVDEPSVALRQVLGKRMFNSVGGYFDTPLQPGYVPLAEGWSTNMPDDTVRRKETVIDFGEWLNDNGEYAPGEGLYVLVECTSNIFSQAVTVFCKEEDKQAIQEWLSAAGYGVDDLYYALS